MKIKQSAQALSKFCFEQVAEAVKDPNHPWRLCNLSFLDQNFNIKSMTIVLRDFHKSSLTLFTDYRSQKIQALQHHPKASICFYNYDLGLQLQVNAKSTIHHQDSLCNDYWKQLSDSSKSCYAAGPSPGTVLEKPFSFVEHRSSSIPYDNFALLKMEIESFDIVLLDKEGNIRAQGELTGDELNAHWLAP